MFDVSNILIHHSRFRDNGKHALIIYDDLLNMPLPKTNVFIIEKTSGREAFPGDIFMFILDYWNALLN